LAVSLVISSPSSGGTPGGVEPGGGLRDHVQGEHGIHRVDGQHVRERRAVDVLHDQVRWRAGPGVAVVVDPGDARVGQRAGVLRFGAETLERLRMTGVLRPQELDRYWPVEHQVRRPPHLTDAPGRDGVTTTTGYRCGT